MINKLFRVMVPVLLFFATLFALFWIALKKLYWSDAPYEQPQSQQLKTPKVTLHEEDIGRWKFFETEISYDVEGFSEEVPANIAYYRKKISEWEIEETAAVVYRFSSNESARKELEKKNELKD